MSYSGQTPIQRMKQNDRAGMIAFLIIFGAVILFALIASETPSTSLPDDCIYAPEKAGGC